MLDPHLTCVRIVCGIGVKAELGVLMMVNAFMRLMALSNPNRVFGGCASQSLLDSLARKLGIKKNLGNVTDRDLCHLAGTRPCHKRGHDD